MIADRADTDGDAQWFTVYGHPDGSSGGPVFRQDFATGKVCRVDGPQEPVFQVVGNDVWAPQHTEPVFVIRGHFVYTTPAHAFGGEPDPWFQIRSVRESWS